MAPSGTSAEVSYLWDLQSIGISPEDSYEFFVEVFDNDRITGPKSARTSVIALRLPSLADVFRQAEKKQDDAAKDLETVMKKAEEVARDMEQMQREMMKQKRMASDWNAQKKMDDMLKQQEAMQEKLQQAQEKLEQMTDMLKVSGDIAKVCRAAEADEVYRFQRNARCNGAHEAGNGADVAGANATGHEEL
jgi:DNA-binding protein YbaB